MPPAACTAWPAHLYCRFPSNVQDCMYVILVALSAASHKSSYSALTSTGGAWDGLGAERKAR